MKIILSPQSIQDIDEIYDFIVHDSETYAKGEVLKIKRIIEHLETFPDLGHKISEFKDLSFREIIKNPYRIIYRKKNNILEIVTILRVEKFVRKM